MPYVVIGDVGDDGVGHARFAGQERLGDGGHADDIESKLAEDAAFRFRAEARPLDDDELTPFVHGLARGRHRIIEHIRQIGADGLGHGDVHHQARFIKEGLDAQAGAVEELAGDDDVARFDLLAQGAARVHGDEVFYAQGFEAPDVGAGVECGGVDEVAAAMTGQKGHALAVNVAQNVVIAGVSKRRFDVNLFDIAESWQIIDATTADNADADGFGHKISSFFSIR